MEKEREKYSTLLRDLLHLEVTLVYHPFTDRIAAPDPATQLVDIQRCYESEITPMSPIIQEMRVKEFEELDPDALESMAQIPVLETGGSADLRQSFTMLAEAAGAGVTAVETIQKHPQTVPLETVAGVESLESDLDDQKQIMLRIRENSRQICRILEEANYQPIPEPTAESQASNQTKQGINLEFKPEHIMQIRKFWEVRPQDRVIMRTVIGMDGDVIAHIDPKVSGEDFDYLHKLHEQSVATSVGFWSELVGIVKDFVTTAVNAIGFR
jgi:hypothetical protein